jgi:hypothetical protein
MAAITVVISFIVQGCIHNTLFFLTCEWEKQARVLYNTWLEKLASDKHSNVLGQFVSYVENVVL